MSRFRTGAREGLWCASSPIYRRFSRARASGVGWRRLAAIAEPNFAASTRDSTGAGLPRACARVEGRLPGGWRPRGAGREALHRGRQTRAANADSGQIRRSESRAKRGGVANTIAAKQREHWWRGGCKPTATRAESERERAEPRRELQACERSELMAEERLQIVPRDGVVFSGRGAQSGQPELRPKFAANSGSGGGGGGRGAIFRSGARSSIANSNSE